MIHDRKVKVLVCTIICNDKIILIPYSMLLFMTQITPFRMHVTRTSEISVYEYDTDMYMYAMIKNSSKWSEMVKLCDNVVQKNRFLMLISSKP